MRQKESLPHLGGRIRVVPKDNRLLANLRRYERSYQGKPERVLTVFAELIEASGLERALNVLPYTIFAPHNAAFARFKRPATQEALKQFIWDHVVEKRLTIGGGTSRERNQFPREGEFRNMGGHLLKMNQGQDGTFFLTGGGPGPVRILETDIAFETGIIHFIERFTPVSTPTRID
ncbi:fasciclin domain-containing protein [Armatimonas sp.]|uniref:fasciclin domain-containing protein n=1 Tax=Armatimonas sp. TaxID=1872638 RepID=UPI00286A0173|nr:fasciclin domain-containing protein [Armatimonas sp.]